MSKKHTDIKEMFEKAKQTKVETPKQRVVPIIEKEEETTLGITLPVTLKNFIKIQAVKENLAIKDIIINSIQEKYKSEL